MRTRPLVPTVCGVLIPVLAVAQEAPRPVLISSQPNLEIRLSGRIHRMIQTVDDGREPAAFFTDSAQGPTMLRFDVTRKASETLTVGFGALIAF